jgi:hypothetical protein
MVASFANRSAGELLDQHHLIGMTAGQSGRGQTDAADPLINEDVVQQHLMVDLTMKLHVAFTNPETYSAWQDIFPSVFE